MSGRPRGTLRKAEIMSNASAPMHDRHTIKVPVLTAAICAHPVSYYTAYIVGSHSVTQSLLSPWATSCYIRT